MKKLPRSDRLGLFDKIDELVRSNADPREYCKPLTGPLQGHYRVKYSRYRAVLSVEERTMGEDVFISLRVCVIAAGIRRERDKRDVYELAKKLAGLIAEEEQAEVRPRKRSTKRR